MNNNPHNQSNDPSFHNANNPANNQPSNPGLYNAPNSQAPYNQPGNPGLHNPNNPSGQTFYNQYTVPGQFHIPPPANNLPQSPAYSKAILGGIVVATVIAFILIAIGSNSTSSTHPASFATNFGTSIFIGIIVSIMIIDWHGLVSLRGWVNWKTMRPNNRTKLGCLFFFLFPFVVCIYLFRASMNTFTAAPVTSATPYASMLVKNSRRTGVGLIAGSAVALVSLLFSTAVYAGSTSTTTAPISPVVTQISIIATPTLKPAATATPIPTPTPIPAKPTPTPIPVQPTQPPAQPQATQPPAQPKPTQPPAVVGVNNNPWGYDFNQGNFIYAPPPDFCGVYFSCIKNFPKGNGYVVECGDTMYSKSGGLQGVCSQHSGFMRALYSH